MSLKSPSPFARVRFYEGQFLRADEMVDEQAYHLAAHRRHHNSMHRWGIASGLDLVVDENGQPRVDSGHAVDGYGRDLVLANQLLVSPGAFDDLGSDLVDVWLVYDRQSSDPAPAGYTACVPGPSGSKGPSSLGAPGTRWQETPRLRLTRGEADPGLFDPRRPADVGEGDLPQLPPERTPPDSPNAQWPVFLGRLLRERSGSSITIVADPAQRPYVGALAASVAAPWRRDEPWLSLGDDHSADDTEAGFSLRLTTTTGTPVNVLDADAAGRLTVHNGASVQGDVRVEGGGVTFAPASEPPPAVSGTPRPFRLWHAAVSAAEIAAGAEPSDELRIEMGAGATAVQIGVFSKDDKAFKSCLTVASDCTVTVHGNLVVEGAISSVATPFVGGLTKEARSFVLGSFGSGIAGLGGSALSLRDLGRTTSGVVAMTPPIAADGPAFIVPAPSPGTGSPKPKEAPQRAPALPLEEALARRLRDDPDLADRLAATLRALDVDTAARLAGKLASD